MIYLYIILTSVLTAFVFVLLLLSPLSKVFELKTPVVLMKEGKIYESALKGSKITYEMLMSEARSQGYFNLGDIDTAIMETSGKISFLPMPMKRNLNPKDFNFAPIREGLCKTVIENGEINEKNLRSSGITRNELKQLLEKRGETEKSILLATVNEAGRVDFFSK